MIRGKRVGTKLGTIKNRKEKVGTKLGTVRDQREESRYETGYRT